MNQFIGIGRLTADAKLSIYEEEKKTNLKFNLAINRTREETDFFPCIVFGKYAESIAKYMMKGKLIAIQGQIHITAYDKEGETEYFTSVVCEKVELLSPKGKNEK